jgi:hypothetical protein
MKTEGKARSEITVVAGVSPASSSPQPARLPLQKIALVRFSEPPAAD